MTDIHDEGLGSILRAANYARAEPDRHGASFEGATPDPNSAATTVPTRSMVIAELRGLANRLEANLFGEALAQTEAMARMEPLPDRPPPPPDIARTLREMSPGAILAEAEATNQAQPETEPPTRAVLRDDYEYRIQARAHAFADFGPEIFRLGPIGSRGDFLYVNFVTGHDYMEVATGCFDWKPLSVFAEANERTHPTDLAGAEYRLTIRYLRDLAQLRSRR